jgi:hypothetical protein
MKRQIGTDACSEVIVIIKDDRFCAPMVDGETLVVNFRELIRSCHRIGHRKLPGLEKYK